MEVVFRVWLFCLGLVMGSFFNVVIYRLRGDVFSQTWFSLPPMRPQPQGSRVNSGRELSVAERDL